ncbi:MAG: hypothetical protein IJN11_08080 [Oscillospiraceae bacterium]|nr:hypothetical protein [Oscillospiraceae bacterium]MBQ7013853.1 hypothetical protein [Oscillospiraceae bacterium]
MAFMGVLLVFVIVGAVLLLAGLVPLIAGSILYSRTRFRKTGLVLRLIGIIILTMEIGTVLLAAIAMILNR